MKIKILALGLFLFVFHLVEAAPSLGVLDSVFVETITNDNPQECLDIIADGAGQTYTYTQCEGDCTNLRILIGGQWSGSNNGGFCESATYAETRTDATLDLEVQDIALGMSVVVEVDPGSGGLFVSQESEGFVGQRGTATNIMNLTIAHDGAMQVLNGGAAFTYDGPDIERRGQLFPGKGSRILNTLGLPAYMFTAYGGDTVDVTFAYVDRSETQAYFGSAARTQSIIDIGFIVAADADEDGQADWKDNCTDEDNGPLALDAGGNSQFDADGDGYGNICDGDLDNDGDTDNDDYALYGLAHRTEPGDPNYNPDADFNGDSEVNTLDLWIFRDLYSSPPGPSGIAP